MTATKKRPFKKFFCDRPEAFLLPPAAFKIWMYHFARENADRKSWPSVETVMEKCDLGRKAVYQWRAWLQKNGWLVRVGEKRSTRGQFSVPMFMVRRGLIQGQTRVDHDPQNGSRTHPQKGVTDQSPKGSPEVDLEKQVDKERGNETENPLPFLDPEMEEKVWGYYIENVKPESTYSFTPSRKKMLSQRYREMISAGKNHREAFIHLREAIFALSEDDYHMGRKKKYEGRFQNDFKDVFGTQEVFEKWCSTYQANEKAGRA